MPRFDYPVTAELTISFTGTSPDEVRGYFEPQSTPYSCYACCLSNAICARGSFVGPDDVIDRFHMAGWTNGPKAHEYEEMINIALSDLARSPLRATRVDQGLSGANLDRVVSALDEGKQVILGIRSESHVVNLLAHGRHGDTTYFLFYDPADGGGYNVADWSGLAERNAAGTAFII